MVFDLGKVLLDFDYGRTVARIAGRCSVPASGILAAIDQSHLLHAFETGKLTREVFREEVSKLVGYGGGASEFEEAFADIFSEMPAMIAWQERLRAAGVPTYIFSNTNELAVQHIQSLHSFFERFDGYVYSYECGAMKPDSRMYEAVEALVGVNPSQLFYIDDRLENVEAAVKRGWQTVWHKTADDTITAGRATGLPG